MPAWNIEDAIFVLDTTATTDEMGNEAPISTEPSGGSFREILQAVAIAALVAIHGLAPARPEGRAAQGCGEHDMDGGRDRAPLWPRVGEAMSKALAEAARSIKGASRKILDFIRDTNTVARASRWLDLSKKIIVQDMPAFQGDRRRESQEQLVKDLPRLHITSWWKREEIRCAVQEICTKVAGWFPVAGYNQVRVPVVFRFELKHDC